MSQISSDSFDTLHNAGNGEAHTASRALVLRERESQALSPYVLPGGMSPYGGDAGSSGLSFSQLLHALRRRWLLALCVGLLIGVPLAAIVFLIAPENYEVVAWLKVGDDPATLLESGSYIRRDPKEYEQFQKTQATLIESPEVLRMVLNDPAVASLPMLREELKPVELLKEEISVAVPFDSEVLQIKMRGKDRAQLVKIVNAVKDSYLKNIVEKQQQVVLEQYNLIDETVKERLAEIRRKREELQRLAKDLSSGDVASVKVVAELKRNQAQALQQRISQLETDLTRLSARITVAAERKNNGGSSVPEHLVEQLLSRDPSIAQLSEQMSAFQQALLMQMRAAKFPERDPGVRRFRQQIAAFQSELDERKADLTPQVEKSIQQELDRDISLPGEPTDPETMLAKQKTLQEHLESLNKEYLEAEEAAAMAINDSADLKNREEEIKDQAEIAAGLQNDLSKLKLVIKMPPRVTTLMEATEPEGANAIFRYVLTAFAGIVGLAIGAGGVLAMEYQARRVNSSSDMSLGVGLRVLGTVPNVARLSHSKGLNGSAALQGILAESVDSIRTMLLASEEAPHAVVVTSAGDREGKTTVATHLAASLARSGRRTLLVDGDLRSPSIHAMFGAAPEPGVCEVLRGEADFEGVLQPTSVDGLMLVAAGQCDHLCIAALAKDSFKDFVQKAREQFEYVIVDSAPVLTYADMLLMGVHADAAVLSVRRDVSQMHRVYEARERMETVGIRVLGAVVNGISEVSRRPAYALPAG